jgi:predicted  nucleic acid-binding Zn-ribbon protein
MLDIEDITGNPVFALLLLVVCAFLWQIVQRLFEKMTHSKEKESKEVVRQLETMNATLIEFMCDLKVLTHQTAQHTDCICKIEKRVDEHGKTLVEHSKKLSRHELKIEHIKG